ncbi:MAG: propanediol/glycerol family dehydratase medium subunit [Synergistetes bacterium]|nr:MAG: Dehydratase medium subunit [bacterium 42_11]MBC7332691.1 propanediol/glycerol family dehydratase medium subunit [Synergistota bacterium]MDK2870676.1 propanediol dehydratase medium subunit [bacterium]
MVAINEELVRKVVAEVLAEVLSERKASSTFSAPSATSSQVANMKLVEVGPAKKGTDPREVVIGISPGFGTVFHETIVGVPHSEVLRQVIAGIEEEGLKARVVKVYPLCDVGFIGKIAANLSGSGVGIGILSRGTAVIHHKDLPPLGNLELFPQAPLLDAEVFRSIGRNAAKYAKGEHPTPVPTRNDPMARPRYQGLAALLHNKEARYVDESKPPMEVKVEFLK